MKSTALFNHKGFTLVESIVAGALSVFVLLIAITVYTMNSKQISGSFVRSLTGMQYQTIINQIESKAREASLISLTSTTFTDTDTLADTSNEIYFLDTAGTVLGGFKRSGLSFMEWKSGAFSTFKVGTKSFVLDTTIKLFIIAPDRKSVLLNLTIFGADGSTRDTVISKREMFVCRN